MWSSVVLCAAGLTQMLDYYAGNSYDERDSRMAGNGSSRGARSGEMQVRHSATQQMSLAPSCTAAQANLTQCGRHVHVTQELHACIPA